MKAPPKLTIPEIAKIYLERSELTIEYVRENATQESAWVIHMTAVKAIQEGWGDPAICRFFKRDRCAVNKIRKEIRQ